MMKEKWNIIAKHLTGENLNKDEHSYIDEVQNNDDSKKLIDDSEEVLNRVNNFYKFNTNKAWTKVDSQISESKNTIQLPKSLLKYAAIFILLIASTVIISQVISPFNTNHFQTAQTDISKPQLTLPDGTIVTLNHGSKLTYPKKFKGETRIVNLQGEAFFDVTPNKEKPFIIQTKNASVKVLGTSFNVYAYKNENTVEVTVETGKVELINGDSNKPEKVVLLPGDKGALDKSTGELHKFLAQKTNSLSWITHDIIFDVTKLSEVISTLEHVYSLNIELDDAVDKNLIITSAFKQQDPDYILDVVALTLDLDITNKGENTYLISNK